MLELPSVPEIPVIFHTLKRKYYFEETDKIEEILKTSYQVMNQNKRLQEMNPNKDTIISYVNEQKEVAKVLKQTREGLSEQLKDFELFNF